MYNHKLPVDSVACACSRECPEILCKDCKKNHPSIYKKCQIFSGTCPDCLNTGLEPLPIIEILGIENKGE